MACRPMASPTEVRRGSSAATRRALRELEAFRPLPAAALGVALLEERALAWGLFLAAGVAPEVALEAETAAFEDLLEDWAAVFAVVLSLVLAVVVGLVLAADFLAVTLDFWVFSTFCAMTAVGLNNSAATQTASAPIQLTGPLDAFASARPHGIRASSTIAAAVVTNETACACVGNHPENLFLICTAVLLIACDPV